MKKLIILLICVSIFLCGCSHQKIDNNSTTKSTTTTTQTTKPLHSEFYIENLAVEDVIKYFKEVSLDSEFVNSGNPKVVQKWVEPITYCLFGEPTEEDENIINSFCEQINQIHGFPGITQVSKDEFANLEIFFCDENEMIDRLGDNFYGMDGGVTFWYEENEIYSATICCRTDLDQILRNSVIQEEIYNGLGPLQDTVLREDSLIYQEFSQPQKMTEIDLLILKLLYHPNIKCGMNDVECEKVIRSLYY